MPSASTSVLPSRTAKQRPGRNWFKLSYLIVLVLVAFAVVMPLVAPENAIVVNPARRFQHPFGATLFGTDNLGRDLGTLVAIGLRTSLLIASLVVLIAGLIGWVTGAISAYAGGWVDDVLGRVMDAFNTFPGIILAISLTTALGPGFWTLIWVLVMVTWVNYARVVRARVLALKAEEYIVAARSYGAPAWFVLFHHIRPNTTDLVASVALGQIANVMLAESTITFLGFGLQPPNVSLGLIITTTKDYLQINGWPVMFAGLVLVVACTSIAMSVIALRRSDR
jgi:peptide/nickel transport system permease protein